MVLVKTPKPFPTVVNILQANAITACQNSIIGAEYNTVKMPVLE